MQDVTWPPDLDIFGASTPPPWQGPRLSQIMIGPYVDDGDKTPEALAAKALLKIWFDKILPVSGDSVEHAMGSYSYDEKGNLVVDTSRSNMLISGADIEKTEFFIKASYAWTNEAQRLTQTNAKTVWIDHLGETMDNVIQVRSVLFARGFGLKNPTDAALVAALESVRSSLAAWGETFRALLEAIAKHYKMMLIVGAGLAVLTVILLIRFR